MVQKCSHSSDGADLRNKSHYQSAQESCFQPFFFPRNLQLLSFSFYSKIKTSLSGTDWVSLIFFEVHPTSMELYFQWHLLRIWKLKAFNPAAVLNEGDALVKCQQNAIKVTFYVKVISTGKTAWEADGTWNIMTGLLYRRLCVDW